jgi:type II secretory pathway pseudopilin PulG
MVHPHQPQPCRRGQTKPKGTQLHNSRRNAYSLIELTITVAMIATMTTILTPALNSARTQMRDITSQANLSTIGQVSAMYALDHDDRIFSFTWRGGETYINLRDGKARVASNDRIAAAWQTQNILQRATGRITGQFNIRSPNNRLMYQRWSHLVLADYMGGNVTDPLWADPADTNLLHWQLNPLECYEDGNTFPFGNGHPGIPGYDKHPTWRELAIIQLWPFASSYQIVPHAWNEDFEKNQYSPISYTTNLFAPVFGGAPTVGERRNHEVRFPTMKVHMFEEFDREQAGSPYFAYDHAAPAKLMFDGSINTLQSGLAQSSVSPNNYLFGRKAEWSQYYVPIDTFPIPLGGLADLTELNMRYRWTLGGLSGIDYPAAFAPASRK